MVRNARDVRYAVGLDSTVEALRRAWRAEALEEAARVCEERAWTEKCEADIEARECAAAIRALKDKT